MAEELTYSQFPFLKELGIEEENAGVFNGKWFGSGETYVTHNPTNNKAIARVKKISESSFKFLIVRREPNKTTKNA